MPTKLTDLKITKVDFVDAGANQRAHIALFKHAPKGGEEVGESKIKNIIHAIAKRFGLEEEEVADVAKSEGGAKTFGAANSELKQQRVCEEIWNVTDALCCSLMSIVRDDTVTDKTALLKQSLSEFNTAALGFANQWGGGNVAEVQKHMNPISMTAEDIEIMKSRVAALGEDETPPVVEEAEPVGKAEEDAEMKIDKSKMTAGERAFYEEIEKRYGAPEEADTPSVPAAPMEDTSVQKSAAEVLKDVMPEFAAMLENVQKRMEKQEDDEIMQIAKQYELLGKKPEELAPVLKSTKAASEEAYTQIITALDAALDIAKRSGMFNEIGSNGNGGATDAEARIAKRVEEIRKAHPEMSVFVARDMAFQENPELIAEFE